MTRLRLEPQIRPASDATTDPPTVAQPTVAQPTVAQPTVVQPTVAQPIALTELAGPSETASLLLADANPLHHVRTRLSISVGETTVTVGELLAARLHQVLVLDRGVEQPVDVRLEGRVVARGQLIAVDDRFAVRITELPVPLHA